MALSVDYLGWESSIIANKACVQHKRAVLKIFQPYLSSNVQFFTLCVIPLAMIYTAYFEDVKKLRLRI